MSTETLDALRATITTWRQILAGERIDCEPPDCPLCQLLNTTIDLSICPCCPVAQETAVSMNRLSCCSKYADALRRNASEGELSRLAQSSLDFLTSLLPEGVSP